MIGIKPSVILLTLLLLLSACQKEMSRERILFDFETSEELDQLHWQCHTLYSLSSDHASHGLKSLKMELYPSDYPGLVPSLTVRDWRRYQELSFDVYNPSEQSVLIGVRIDDRADYPDNEDRYNKSFVLQQGMNHISIPLDSLTASGARPLDLAQVQRMFIFLNHPLKKNILYFDNIRMRSK